MSYVVKLFNAIKNRDLSIEERVGIMFISIGVIASVIGEIICLFCHASAIGSVIVVIITISAIISIQTGINRSDVDFIRKAMIVCVSILIPGVFVTSGGNNSGCIAWLIYELFYITLACRESKLHLVLILDGVVDLALLIADYLGAPFIYHLPTERDVFISIFCSVTVVSLAILATVFFYKRLYREEREYLVMQQRELEKANQVGRNIMASMSHELRTPVNSIIGFNDLILKSDNYDKVSEYASDVRYASEYLLTKIDDILDFASIQSGKMELDMADYSVEELIRVCHDMISVRAKDKNLKLVVEADPQIPKMLHGDAKRIKQLTINILMNAVKYSEEGTVTFSIGLNKRQLTKGDSDGKVIGLAIKIEDEGVGIADDKQATIFRPLESLNDIKVQNVQGSGLGLALTKHLVDMMDGELIVESTLGAGSVFTVIIPQVVSSKTTIGTLVFDEINSTIVDEENKLEENAVEDPAKDDIKSILVVDDTAINLKLMSLMLKNYDVTTLDRGQKAIDACRDKKYAVILMDIMMPEMDGVEAMKIIKSECYGDVPIIAVTADAVPGAREQYLAEGFSDYISKPVKADILNAVLANYMM